MLITDCCDAKHKPPHHMEAALTSSANCLGSFNIIRAYN